MDSYTSKLFTYVRNNHEKLIETLFNCNDRLALSKHACCQPKNKLNTSTPLSQYKPDEFQNDCCMYVQIIGNITKNKNDLITIIQEKNNTTISILILLHSLHYINQLNKNDFIIIKEPMLKEIKLLNKPIQILIVDNIYFNIILIDNHINNNNHDEKKENDLNCNTLKEKGNKYFSDKQYLCAINCYSKALNELKKLKKPKNSDLKFKLLCNRSLLFIQINHYFDALIDAQHALKLNNNSCKAKFRCITALVGVGRYLKAMKLLKSIQKTDIKSSSIKKKFDLLQKEIVVKYSESMGILKNDKNEKIDFALYPSFAHKIKWQKVSDFIGPLAIKYINKKKGRGVFATKDIKCGDIILIEKVFAKGIYDSKQKKCFSKQELLLMDIIQKIYPTLQRDGFEYDPFLLYAKRLSFLCNYGCDKNLLKNKIPDMDLFKYNEYDNSNNNKIMLTINDIVGIIECNPYESLIDPNDIDLIETKYAKKNKNKNNNLVENKMYLGLWLITAFINHNNKPNVYRIIWYNTMIIIADKDIKKGSEICLSYLNPFLSQNEKKNQLFQGWGIQ